MLTDLIRVERPHDDAAEPEDIFADALSLFPDEARNMHGDPGGVVVYASARFGDLRLRIAQPEGEGERRLFAHYVWNSCVLLAERVAAAQGGPWSVEGQRVLELGAAAKGVGISGIVAALCGAQHVVISDYPSMPLLENIEDNVRANVAQDLPCELRVHGHIWGEFGDELSKGYKGYFTRVFAADCFWMPWEHGNLVNSMLHFLSPDPGARVCTVAGFHTGRAKLAPFYSAAEDAGLEIEEIYEVDIHDTIRPWVKERDGGKEDVTERKSWLAVAVLRLPVPRG